jgi:hypothetical protein
MWAVLNPLFMGIHLVCSLESSAVMTEHHYTSNFKVIHVSAQQERGQHEFTPSREWEAISHIEGHHTGDAQESVADFRRNTLSPGSLLKQKTEMGKE